MMGLGVFRLVAIEGDLFAFVVLLILESPAPMELPSFAGAVESANLLFDSGGSTEPSFRGLEAEIVGSTAGSRLATIAWLSLVLPLPKSATSSLSKASIGSLGLAG